MIQIRNFLIMVVSLAAIIYVGMEFTYTYETKETTDDGYRVITRNQHGQHHGVTRSYDKDGDLTAITHYSYGSPVRGQTFHKGEPVSEWDDTKPVAPRKSIAQQMLDFYQTKRDMGHDLTREDLETEAMFLSVSSK